MVTGFVPSLVITLISEISFTSDEKAIDSESGDQEGLLSNSLGLAVNLLLKGLMLALAPDSRFTFVRKTS